jgi:hypothetical protein
MPDDTQIDLGQTVAALRRELGARTAERDEALAREAAITEVFQVINTSPGDLAPVFQTIVEEAHTLCDAASGSLPLWDGKKFRGVAMRGFSEAMKCRASVSSRESASSTAAISLRSTVPQRSARTTPMHVCCATSRSCTSRMLQTMKRTGLAIRSAAVSSIWPAVAPCPQ